MLGLALGLEYQQQSSDTSGAAVEDEFFEGYVAGSGAGSCELQPLESGTVVDNHDVWDLDGTNYMPVETSSLSLEEGYWEVGTGEISPLMC